MNIFQRTKAYIKFIIKAKPLIGHGIHSPFVYNLASQILLPAKSNKNLIPQVEKVRNTFRANKKKITINDLGTGNRKISYKRSITSIARKSTSNERKCRMFYALAAECKPSAILELGTSLGISAMTFALGAPNAKVFTIEGSEEISNVAKESIAKENLTNIIFKKGNFDKKLPELLPSLTKPFIAYIDGNHSLEATRRYFEMILPFADENSLLIFDDIHWSADMEKAWDVIRNNPKVILSIDMFQLGLVYFRNGVPKQHFYIRY